MKISWKKGLQNTAWLLLTAAGIALLVAAVQRKDNKVCTDIKVELSGFSTHVFMEEKEIMRLLNSNGSLKGQPVETINLQLMERRLERDKWIRNAELFFDNNQVLQVKVEEREPVARVFTIAGNSFYIDSTGMRLPLGDVSIRVPMFTSFPAVGSRLGTKDSVLMEAIKDVARFINADEFWSAQVAQIDITPQRTFEMIPTIGDHVVKLGRGNDIEQKFNRLFSFYKQVWTKVGLEKYATVDVQFKDQVIATRKGTWTAAVDSTKAKEAFKTLIEDNKPDTVEVSAPKKQVVVRENKGETKVSEKAKASEVKAVEKEAKQQEKVVDKVPKAVMQKQQ